MTDKVPEDKFIMSKTIREHTKDAIYEIVMTAKVEVKSTSMDYFAKSLHVNFPRRNLLSGVLRRTIMLMQA